MDYGPQKTKMARSKMATWRDQQKERLREHLYCSSLELLRKKDFQDTTVQEIVEAAGVSKATFFNYFISKGYILTEWFERITTSALNQARASHAEPGIATLPFLQC